MKKLPYLSIAFVLLITFQSQAQSEYKSAIGGRVGIPIAGSIKHFIFESGALEGYAGFNDAGSFGNGINIITGGMYQHHFPIGDIPGFKWYVGGGVLVEFFTYKGYNNSMTDYSKAGFAVNGVGGVDYKFKSIPLNVSADFMPAIFLGNSPRDFRPYGGVAARFTFN